MVPPIPIAISMLVLVAGTQGPRFFETLLLLALWGGLCVVLGFLLSWMRR